MRLRSIAGVIGVLTVLLVGCGNQMDTGYENTDSLTMNSLKMKIDQEGDEFSIPSVYEKRSETEKVSFFLTPEYPDSIVDGVCVVPEVRGRVYADTDSVYKMFVKDRELDKLIDDGEETGDGPRELHYIFQDGAVLTCGRDVNYVDVNKSKYYINTQYQEEAQLSQFQNDELSFMSKGESVEKIKDMLSESGISPDIFDFSVVALDHGTLRQLEESLLKENLIDSEERKDDWEESDDAYYIYAYQEENGITIFNENMSVIREFADDGPSNAAFYALINSEGVVNFHSSFVYDLDWDTEPVELKPFEQIADVVEQKYDMILNDADYVVTRARFALEISLDERQCYQSIPIWYFEVIENDTTRSIVWINAATGEEIYLG